MVRIIDNYNVKESYHIAIWHNGQDTYFTHRLRSKIVSEWEEIYEH